MGANVGNQDVLETASNVEGPVRQLATQEDAERKGPEPGIGLCLSGGGYRAMVFHIGVLWRLHELGILAKIDRFSKPYMGDYRVGLVRNPTASIAEAVAASSAFPPVLSPAFLDVDQPFDPSTAPKEGSLQHEPFTKKVVLSDGGVYDNLGLETVFKLYQTVLVSDAGGQPDPRQRGIWMAVCGISSSTRTSLRPSQSVASVPRKSVAASPATMSSGAAKALASSRDSRPMI